MTIYHLCPVLSRLVFAALSVMAGGSAFAQTPLLDIAPVAQLPPATLVFSAQVPPGPALGETGPTFGGTISPGAGICPRGPQFDVSENGGSASASSAAAHSGGAAIYGGAYGENRGGAPGSTIDQSSTVLGTACVPSLY